MTEHLLPIPMERILAYGVGILWTITYLLIIYKGFRDRACGMPFAALCANFTWELLFSFIFPFEKLQLAVTLIWLALDFIILCQFIRYSNDSHSSLYRNSAYLILFPSLLMAFLLQFAVTVEFHDYVGRYSAFGINLLMSLLFVNMLMDQGLRGQSIFIAYTKMAGTLCASLLFFSLYPESILLTLLYILTFILDVIYIIMMKSQSAKAVRKSAATPGRKGSGIRPSF